MKKTMRIALTLLCMLMAGRHAWALDANLRYYFTHIDNRNGLSENCVKAITQDRLGFIWLGTKNGLNRYDGRSLKRFDVDDLETGRGNHNVSALKEDEAGRLWVGTDKGVFVMDTGSETFASFDVATADGQQVRNWIAQIDIGADGTVWIVSPEEGVFAYDPHENALHRYSTRRATDAASFNPQSICLRGDDEVWIGTAGQGIFCLDIMSGTLRQTLADAEGRSLAGRNIYTMHDYGDWLLIGEHEHQLRKYDPRTNTLADVDAPGVHYKIIRDIDVDGDNIFVATQDGLYIVNERLHTEQRLHEDDLMPNCLSDNMIYTLYRDRDRGLWIGTMQSGVNYMPMSGLHFYSYVPTGRHNSLSQKHVRELVCDGRGNIWVACEGGNVNVFHPDRQDFESIATPHYRGGTNRLALMLDGEQLWSGLFKNGLDIIGVTTHQLVHYTPSQLGLRVEGSVYALCRDSEGRVWLGTGNGVYIKDAGMHFNKVATIPDIFAQDIVEDRAGRIWIATIGSGIFCHDPRSARTQQYTHTADDDACLSSNDVSSITIGSDGRLWLATDRGGLCVCDPETRTFHTYGKADGLPDDVTYKVLEDSLHRMWFGTNHGLVCLDPATGKTNVYYNHSGLPGNQFNYKSAAIGTDGLFYLGGTAGLTAFNPMLAGTQDELSARVYLTNLRVNRHEVRPGADGVLETNIVEASEIHLPHDFSSFSLDVSSLNYTGTGSDNYEYMLSGVDQQWTSSATGQDISFSRLQPGEYTFRVRQSSTGDARVTELRVVVDHPWWSTVWARLAYVLLAACLVYAAWRRMLRRQRQREMQRQRQFVAEKDKELLQAKIGFFTDITHEIRTPLTLINGSVENLEEMADTAAQPDIAKNVKAIGKNTRRLLDLTNQLLDFRKIDSNSLQLSFTTFSFSQLVSDMVSRFEPALTRQHKTISLDMADDDTTLQADREAVTKTLSNLLNNARKYSETFVQVTVSTTADTLTVVIDNDGPRIPADKAEAIFQPFVQLDNSHQQPGSGLGLPMARTLADMHGGTLTLNTEAQYNEFVLTLPLRQKDADTESSQALPLGYKDDEADTADASTQTPSPLPPSTLNSPLSTLNSPLSVHTSPLHTLLVVEDNAEVLQMLTDNLSAHYTVVAAKNGAQALSKAHAEHIDLVVTDLMMPVMDGLTLCQRLKDDMETSHIPVIMLTAKQTLENRLEGLRAGADAYIEKPFSFAHLHTQIETLLQNRRRERENFVRKPYLPMQTSGITKPEEQFMSRITELITKNIRQPEFNVEQLAAEMCMSRSSLHRKIKEVSDMTPIDFIRLIRLKKAAELIREQGYRANEVCEMVGITSPSYFIKLFQRQFGMTPKEFAQKKD